MPSTHVTHQQYPPPALYPSTSSGVVTAAPAAAQVLAIYPNHHQPGAAVALGSAPARHAQNSSNDALDSLLMLAGVDQPAPSIPQAVHYVAPAPVPVKPVIQKEDPYKAAVMRDLGEASHVIATAQTAVAQSQVLAQGFHPDQSSNTTKLTKQQAAVRASRENQRIRKQNAKRLEMMAASGMWIAPQPLIQRRRPPHQPPYMMQQVVPQAVMLPAGMYYMSGSAGTSTGTSHAQGEQGGGSCT